MEPIIITTEEVNDSNITQKERTIYETGYNRGKWAGESNRWAVLRIGVVTLLFLSVVIFFSKCSSL